MAYIVGKMEDQFIDAISRPEGWVERDPAMADMYNENRRLRNEHQEVGTTLKTPEWKRVAQIQTSLEGAINMTKDGGFIKDKKAFYAFLKRNPGYLTYDARFGRG